MLHEEALTTQPTSSYPANQRRGGLLVRRSLLAVICSLSSVVLSACGGPDEEASTAAPADTALVALLADLHLADARAETTGERADSLHEAALALHGLDSTEFAERLLRATRVPEDASALYQAVTDRLQATAVQLPDSTGP